MKKFFTSIDKKDVNFIGNVYEQETNRLVHTTPELPSLEGVHNNIQQFLVTQQGTPSTKNTPYIPVAPKTTLCCNRG